MDIKRLEFMVTYHCSGECRHCSVADVLHTGENACVDSALACKAVESLAAGYDVESVMTFGGEPLLYADTVCAIHETAKRCGIPERQLITNGYFSRDRGQIRKTVQALRKADLTDILLSVDAFHQETIPVDIVRFFAETALDAGIRRIRLHPAWVVNESHDNSFNRTTQRVLKSFSDLDITVSNGNDIFLAGNAKNNLARYYDKPELNMDSRCGEMPYTSRLDEVDSLTVTPDGGVEICAQSIGNIYREDLNVVANRFDPHDHPLMEVLLDGSVRDLLAYADRIGVEIDIDGCSSICDICRQLTAKR